jgi:autotransporter-associated beta strand protein
MRNPAADLKNVGSRVPRVLWFLSLFSRFEENSVMRATFFLPAAAVVLACVARVVCAADGTWNTDGNGNWSDTTKWDSNIVADGAGATAHFDNAALSAARTITLDSSRTIGNLYFDDKNASSQYRYTVQGSNTLTLQGSSTPELRVVADTSTSDNVILGASTGWVLAGNQGFTKTGDGLLYLRGITNTITGTFEVSAGSLELNTTCTDNDTQGLNGCFADSTTRTFQVDNGARLQTQNWVLGTSNDVVLNGGTLTTTGASCGGYLGNVTMTGGTISNSGGSSYFVGGRAANPKDGLFTINASGTASTIATNLYLRRNGASKVTFDVADGAAANDLIVGRLYQEAGTGAPLEVVKDGEGTMLLNGVYADNTVGVRCTGSIQVNAGTLAVDSASQLMMDVNPTGAFTQILGTGSLNFDGTMLLDLRNIPSSSTSGSWRLIDTAKLTESYGETFAVALADFDSLTTHLFTNAGAGVWTYGDASTQLWTFTQSTGALTLVPEPSVSVMLLSGLLGLVAYAWRKRR